MSENTERTIYNRSTSSSEASPASLFPMQESEKEGQMTATSGLRCYALYEKYTQCGSLVRMLVESSRWKMAKHLKKYALIWRVKGTKYNRCLYQLRLVERGIDERGYGLLPTPNTQDTIDTPCEITDSGRRVATGESRSINLARLARMGLLRTPTSQDPGTTEDGKTAKSPQYKMTLLEDFMKEGGMLPTPTSSMGDKDRGNMSHEAVRKRIEIGKQLDLSMSFNGHLSPQFTEWLMGFPIGWTDKKCDKLSTDMPDWSGTYPSPTTRRIKGRNDRLKQMGNAIVPHCAYALFSAIKAYEK